MGGYLCRAVGESVYAVDAPGLRDHQRRRRRRPSALPGGAGRGRRARGSLCLRYGRSRSAQRVRRGAALPATAVLAMVVAAFALLVSA
jgi:hypothetical protein